MLLRQVCQDVGQTGALHTRKAGFAQVVPPCQHKAVVHHGPLIAQHLHAHAAQKIQAFINGTRDIFMVARHCPVPQGRLGQGQCCGGGLRIQLDVVVDYVAHIKDGIGLLRGQQLHGSGQPPRSE